ncbi:MAG: carbohydrate-binding protein [Chitinophagales bacterium]
MAKLEWNGGIEVSPAQPQIGDEVQIVYSGLLAGAGADKVFVHVGYGSQNGWSDVKDYEMIRTNHGWETSLQVYRAGQMNLCFKDRANNWDNNSGHNWSLHVDPHKFKYAH